MRLLVLASALILQGCIAKTAVDIASLPVRGVVKIVGAVAPDQARSDRKRGRAERKAEDRAAKAARAKAKQGDDSSERAAN